MINKFTTYSFVTIRGFTNLKNTHTIDKFNGIIISTPSFKGNNVLIPFNITLFNTEVEARINIELDIIKIKKTNFQIKELITVNSVGTNRTLILFENFVKSSEIVESLEIGNQLGISINDNLEKED